MDDTGDADTIIRARAHYTRVTNEQEAQARRPLTPDVLGRDAITEGATRDFIGDEDGQAAVGSWRRPALAIASQWYRCIGSIMGSLWMQAERSGFRQI